jgi:hypothetical protein
MNNYFHRRFTALKKTNKIPETQITIHDFQRIIGLNNIKGGEYSIGLTAYPDHCRVHIHYINKINMFDLITNNIADLPMEINHMINEYLPSYITLELRLDWTPDYPFTPPKWSMVHCNDYLASSLKNAEEYYNYIVSNHNKANKNEWSPAITIDSDILAFMVRIHHFDSLFLQ